MAAEASLRSGAGLVSVVTRSEHRQAFWHAGPSHGAWYGRPWLDFGQLMQRASVLVVGPGLGLGPWERSYCECSGCIEEAVAGRSY